MTTAPAENEAGEKPGTVNGKVFAPNNRPVTGSDGIIYTNEEERAYYEGDKPAQAVSKASNAEVVEITEEQIKNIKDNIYPAFKSEVGNNITYESVANFAQAHNLSDAERLYLSLSIAYDNNIMNKETFITTKTVKYGPFNMLSKTVNVLNSRTYCNAYAAYTNYLYTGSTEMMTMYGKTAADYGYFRDKTRMDWTGMGSGAQGDYFTAQKWQKMTYVEGADIQSLANRGRLIFAVGDGHIAVVSPGKYLGRNDVNYPAIGQQGASKLLYNRSSDPGKWYMNWGWKPTSYKSQVDFYMKP
jgi:rubrerythrin